MGNEHRYFRAGKSARQIIKKFEQSRQEAHDQQIKFCHEQGGKYPVLRGKSMIGMTVTSIADAPGWKPAKESLSNGGMYLVPDARTKRGKDAGRRMARMHIPGSETLAKLLGWPEELRVVGNRLFVSGVTYETHGRTVIVVGPSDCPDLEDCKPLKNSEYWRIVEESEAKGGG